MFMPFSCPPAHRSFYFAPFVCAALLLLLPLARAGAQGGIDTTGTNGRHTISGRIYFPSGRSADVQLRVKLESMNTGGLSILADSNGHFSFRGLSPGNYSITVEGDEEYETARESVYIDTPGEYAGVYALILCHLSSATETEGGWHGETRRAERGAGRCAAYRP